MSESVPAASGQWVMPDVSYVEPMRIFCALCGRPIARRHWRAAPEGVELPFCDPSHEDLYVEYWLPTYRDGPGVSEDALA
jgi:hypothetical protein